VDYQAPEIVVSKVVLPFPTISDWELDSLDVFQAKRRQETGRSKNLGLPVNLGFPFSALFYLL
jgi:hypothetical protein